MALLNIYFPSASLAHNASINVILPDNVKEDIPTLYLLHGMHGDHTGWCRKTNIERYAAEHGIAVVMPDGENSFYTDMKYGKNYFTYIADELVDYTRSILRLSVKREKTFIAGLSMGGYGAVQIALRRPERYAACASLSGCIDIVECLKTCTWNREVTAVWGENYRTCTAKTESDIKYLVETFPANLPKPRIFACCGTEDSFHADNLSFSGFMAGRGFEYAYAEGPGGHDWTFWDKWIAIALDRMLCNIG